MQRQAELKSAYRAIARAQKTLLAEIAQRTIEDLETNPQLHLQALEYDHVKAGLDNAYARRTEATAVTTGDERAATRSNA